MKCPTNFSLSRASVVETFGENDGRLSTKLKFVGQAPLQFTR